MKNSNKFLTRIDDKGRVCTKCDVYKTWDNYVKAAKTQTGRASECKECKAAHKKATKKPATKLTKDRQRERMANLKRTDPLKWKATHLRGGMRSRSKEGLKVPSAPEIEQWLKSIDPFVCYYTEVPLSTNDFSVDHKQPLDRGGTNDFTNLCVCTKQINTTKGTMTAEEFISLLNFLSTWEDKGDKLLRRLRMAGKAFGGKK